MSENGKRVPKRRFKEFENTEGWGQRKLGEFGYFYYGKSAPKWSVTQDARTPCVRYGELYTKHLEKIDKIYSYTNIPKDNLKFSTGKEVLVPRVGEDPLDFANCSWLSIPNVAIGEMISVYNTEQNPLFTAYMFNALLKYEFAKRVEGGNVSNLYYAYLEDISVSFPSIDEQEKIAKFLTDISNLITIHQRKLDKMKALKKAYLTDMFPAEGERKPKLRFAGFTEDWEQRELGEVYQKIRNAFVGTATPYYVEEGHFYLESNNVKDGQINRNSEIFINDAFYERQKDNWLHTNDLVMVQSGHVGHAAVIPENLDNTAAHALIIIANPREKINPHFVNYQFQTKKAKHDIDNITTGNTIKHILSSEMKKFEISVCKYEEQNQISDFFNNLDKLITLHQHKLEKLQNIKKAYLNEMFI